MEKRSIRMENLCGTNTSAFGRKEGPEQSGTYRGREDGETQAAVWECKPQCGQLVQLEIIQKRILDFSMICSYFFIAETYSNF